MKDVCSPINRMKAAAPLPHPDKNKRNPPHAPVYGPVTTGSRNAGRPPPPISAAISVTRAGGRDLSNPDPFPGRSA